VKRYTDTSYTGVSGGKVCILGGHIIANSKYISIYILFRKFSETAISLYSQSSLNLASNIVLTSSVLRHNLKRQLAAVTLDSDIVGVLCKMPHFFTNTEYVEMLYVYCFCDGSAIATVEFSERYYTR
jgi:hypothetical protein